MLISHNHQLIFVKTRKSAGTSCEISLSRYCDSPQDVITPVLKQEKPLQRLVDVTPRNHKQNQAGTKFGAHMSAREIRKIVGEDIWDSYTTACIVRNPWSRAVSQYYFRLHRFKKTPPSFDQFIREKHFTVERSMYCNGQEVLVDHILRFEHLSEDLWVLAESLGIEWDGWLPRSNSGLRPIGKHYSELYSPETREIVREKCAEEIALHGYTFSGASEYESKFNTSRVQPENPVYRRHDYTWRSSSNLLDKNTCKPVLKVRSELENHDLDSCFRSASGKRAFQQDELALEILSLCDGRRSVEEIFLHLKSRYIKTDGELSADILTILDLLHREGVIDATGLTGNASAK